MGVEEDTTNGFLMPADKQIEYMAAQIRNDSRLANGFHAVGFSQGGQFLRAYVQRFNEPPVKTLVTVGGQHQGVFGFPKCPGAKFELCEIVRRMVDGGVYWQVAQDHVAQANYWQDPFDLESYR